MAYVVILPRNKMLIGLNQSYDLQRPIREHYLRVGWLGYVLAHLTNVLKRRTFQ